MAARTVDRVRESADALTRGLAVRTGRAGVAPLAARSEAVRDLRDLAGRLERQLTSGLEVLDRELGQVRETAEQLRLVQASAMFVPLERTLRDAAAVLHKPVTFESSGGDVRLEAHVLAAIQPALVQVIRNAAAHGIESEAIRRAQGKTSAGLVTVRVARRGRRVVFEVGDDGRGVDLDAVRRVAVERGVSGAATAFGAEDLIRLLLRGGISTAPSVTDVAGRGIGLDVVRAAVDELRGEVSVHTEAGRGTTIEIVVPVSVAALDALIVESGGRTAAIPLDAVRRTFRAAPSEISRAAGGTSVLIGGQALPFVALSHLLRAAPRNGSPGAAQSVVVVTSGDPGGAAVALGVDRAIGAARIVMRPVPLLASTEDLVAGLYLDAEGAPQIVVDAEALVRAADSVSHADSPGGTARPSTILVVDDSLTTRMLEQSILESAGYDVHAVTSAEEALEAARRTAYALFLVDVEMPGMDGFTFIERIRADSSLRDVPAILVTSRSSAEDRARGERAGAQGYVVKSEFNQSELLARIRTLVS
jgi:two-component system chemotaxis sensor kinase CheA